MANNTRGQIANSIRRLADEWSVQNSSTPEPEALGHIDVTGDPTNPYAFVVSVGAEKYRVIVKPIKG